FVVLLAVLPPARVTLFPSTTLFRSSVVYQVNGGWAVDALHGSQTRSHGDLDVFVDSTTVDALMEWLLGRGYSIVEDWRPIRVELRAGDRAVDIDGRGLCR